MRSRLAIDIDGNAGRLTLGYLSEGRLHLEEIHRFPNTMLLKKGTLCWNLDALYAEIIAGLRFCAARRQTPESLGLDTWGVDFVLLNEAGELLGDAVTYRDIRTEGIERELFRRVPERELYARTGIRSQPLNTIFQLAALQKKSPALLREAREMLLIPDYLRRLLCGESWTEHTGASTTGLLDIRRDDWDRELIDTCGFPASLFAPIDHPGTRRGTLTGQARQDAGFDCAVILPPSHDTAAAFLAIPAPPDSTVYIYGGTWSLLGLCRDKPILSEEARRAGFTNEKAYGGRTLVVKSIMGLWMIQELGKELPGSPPLPALSAMARTSDYRGTVDIGDGVFLAPHSMSAVIRATCQAGGYPEPRSPEDVLRCVYQSLAEAYARSLRDLEAMTGKSYRSVHIVGPGCGDSFLCELTAKACGLPVYTGPAEPTALGNILAQMILEGELSGPDAAREIVRQSFTIGLIEPK